MVAETSGGWGASAVHVLKGFARATATQQNLDSSKVFNGYLQQLCTAIRKANAKATLRRGAAGEGPAGPVQTAVEAAGENLDKALRARRRTTDPVCRRLDDE